MHPLLRKAKAVALRLSRQAKAGLQRLLARPRSLERLLLFTTAGLVLFSIVAIALTSLGLLRDQASEQALARVRAAAHQARYEIRRVGEETVTASRLLAGRPTLARLVREANAVQLQLFLRRFCETAGLDACATTDHEPAACAFMPIVIPIEAFKAIGPSAQVTEVCCTVQLPL